MDREDIIRLPAFDMINREYKISNCFCACSKKRVELNDILLNLFDEILGEDRVLKGNINFGEAIDKIEELYKEKL